MNVVNSAVKAMVCGAAAMVITLSMSLGVVQSTATYHWNLGEPATRPAVAKLSIQPQHAWFGQPSPAVLVD